MAKGRKKATRKSGGLLFKLFIAAIVFLLLWAAGRFDVKGRTPYEHADGLLHMRLLQPLHDTLCGGVSDVTDDAVNAIEALPEKLNTDSPEKATEPTARPAKKRDETPMDNITEEDRQALDDLIDMKSRKK